MVEASDGLALCSRRYQRAYPEASFEGSDPSPAHTLGTAGVRQPRTRTSANRKLAPAMSSDPRSPADTGSALESATGPSTGFFDSADPPYTPALRSDR